MAERTIGDLQTAIEQKFGLNHSAEGTKVLAWLTAGYRDLHNKIHLAPTSISVSITSGTNEYTLALSLESVEDATVSGSTVKPVRVTVDEILDRRRFVTSGVAPGDVFVYALEGDHLWVYPDPSSSFTFTVYGTSLDLTTADLTTGQKLATDLNLYTQELQDALEMYASWKVAEYDDKLLSENATSYLQLYQAAVTDARKSVRRRGGRGLSPARIGYPGQRGFPKRNDVYPQINR